MARYYHAIAIDYDGTLTDGGHPQEDVLTALAEVRSAGIKIILATGRVFSELVRVFPTVDDCFDFIVAENGAVLRDRGVSRAITAPVPFEIDPALVSQGIAFSRGQVLLACDGEHELTVFRELRRIGSDCQLVRNREALMVLPAGVSKGTGVFEALGELGISYHSTVAVGDAENDLALLARCELRVAVANAVPSLCQHADVVLDAPNGRGVIELLNGPLFQHDSVPIPSRWQIALGMSPSGEVVTLPASNINVLVIGGSGAGKSYVAGLLAERLLELDYSLCIVDPEGDHAPLGRLPGVATVGGGGALPTPHETRVLLRRRLGSLVIDISHVSSDDHPAYLRSIFQELQEERATSGLPHWVIADEAHVPFGVGSIASNSFRRGDKGICLVTYQPSQLNIPSGLEFDYLIALAGEEGLSRETLDGVQSLVGARISEPFSEIRKGEALLVRLGGDLDTSVFELGSRWVRHVRHWNTYAGVHFPWEEAFRFRTFFGPTGAVADNLLEFRRELLRCDPNVVLHHVANRDFSRWIERVVGDDKLARAIQEIEEGFDSERSIESLRREIIEAIENRYLA